MTDNVNHPIHYTSHPAGVECIEITKHHCFSIGNAIKYLWRAGLKNEGTTNAAQDVQKAIWYINQRIDDIIAGKLQKTPLVNSDKVHSSGHAIADITKHYKANVATALSCLMQVGLIPSQATANELNLLAKARDSLAG